MKCDFFFNFWSGIVAALNCQTILRLKIRARTFLFFFKRKVTSSWKTLKKKIRLIIEERCNFFLVKMKIKMNSIEKWEILASVLFILPNVFNFFFLQRLWYGGHGFGPQKSCATHVWHGHVWTRKWTQLCESYFSPFLQSFFWDERWKKAACYNDCSKLQV